MNGARRMSDKKNQLSYLQKASFYDMLAQYYKYLDTNLHIFYYQKHLNSLKKALQLTRTQMIQDSYATYPPAMVRFLHASPDAPNVDIYVNARLVVKNLPYKHLETYLTLPTGKYHIDIYPTGNMVSTLMTKKITVEAGAVYTYAFIGTDKKHQLLPFKEEPGVPRGETKLRFIHLSPDTPPVDIAVRKGDIVFPNINNKKATSYLGLSPMTVNLEVRSAGTKEVILPIPNLQLKANESYTLVAVGFSQKEPALETILIKG